MNGGKSFSLIRPYFFLPIQTRVPGDGYVSVVLIIGILYESTLTPVDLTLIDSSHEDPGVDDLWYGNRGVPTGD